MTWYSLANSAWLALAESDWATIPDGTPTSVPDSVFWLSLTNFEWGLLSENQWQALQEIFREVLWHIALLPLSSQPWTIGLLSLSDAEGNAETGMNIKLWIHS